MHYQICSIFFFDCVLALETPENWGEPIASLNDITERYFTRTEVTIMHEKNDEVSQILITGITKKFNKKSYIIMDETSYYGQNLMYKLNKNHTSDLIVIIRNQEKLNGFFRHPYWNPRGKIVILPLGDDSNPRKIIENVWNATRSVNLVIMEVKPDRINFYTWFPYKKHECLNVSTISLLDTFKNGSYLRGENLFPQKIPRKFEGCPLRIITTEVPPFVFNNFTDGYEQRIISAMADYHNFKLVHVPPHRGEIFWSFGNSTVGFGGALRLLLEQRADISFGSFMTRADRIAVVDFLYPHIHEVLAWVFPAPTLISNFSSIYTIFSARTWFAIVFHHLAIAFTFFYITRKAAWIREPDSFRNFLSCFFTPIAIITNTAIGKPRGIYLRFVTMIYVIYALHITTAYQSSLIVLLQDYDTSKPYESVQELIDDNLVCHFFGGYINNVLNVTDFELWSQILQPGKYKIMDGENIEQLKEEIAFRRTSYMLFSKLHIDHSSAKYEDRLGRSLFNTLPYVSYTTSIQVSPGNPLQDRLTDTVIRLMSAGLIDYWMASVNHRLQGNKSSEEPDVIEDQRTIPLSIRHLEGAFLFHSIFITISLLVFIGEILIHRKFGKKQRRRRGFR